MTVLSVVMGMPTLPNATGAVLPMSASFAASSGLNPRPMSIAPEMATGVPNPAQPSMNAPKQKAMSSAWMRRSALSAEICCFSFAKPPVSTEI